MNTQVHTAATRFVASQVRTEHKKLFNSWISEIPDGYFERFLEKGIIPFLAKFGYTLGLSHSERISMISSWAFAHVQTQRLPKYYGNYIRILKCAHTGGDEEYDWFCHTIEQDSWDTLCETWYSTEFLDDSDPGVSQRLDLPRIIWNMISLENSRTHHKWVDTVLESAEQDDAIQEDNQIAFTGNRRTFS